MDASSESHVAAIFRALMHPTRLHILDLLRKRPHCVCELEATLGFRSAYVAQQLSSLRRARLVTSYRDGWRIYYRITEPAVFELVEAARRIALAEEAAHVG